MKFPGIFRKKRQPAPVFDRERLEPAIRCSICTGEQVAGFQDLKTGKFLEIQLLRRPEDLEQFKKEYGITEEPKKFY